MAEKKAKKETKKVAKKVVGYNITKSNGSIIVKGLDIMNETRIKRYKAKGYKVEEVVE